jgi:DNA-binding HxlR family transcriptional regulator
MALGPGPLRTKELTDQIPEFSVRSVYRCTNEMRAYFLIDRFEEPGVPSTVVLNLSDPAGRNLYRLLRTFATTSNSQFPTKGREAHSWASLSLLSDLWEMGFVEELSHGSRSLTQLASGDHDMTYHQVNRRTGLFITGGLLVACPPTGRGKRYELTNHGRRRMALIAGIGRWRHRHIGGGLSGLTPDEMATVLRAALPLILLPAYAGMSIDLGVTGDLDEYGRRSTKTLQGTVGIDGAMRCDLVSKSAAEGSATATINRRGRVQVSGNLGLVDACLTQLYEVLWEKERPVPAP